jgi:hypothetical protein
MVTIMNIGRVPLQVGLINPTTGAKTSTRIMGRGRGTPPAGFVVDPNWMALYGKNIKVVDITPVVPATPVVAKTTSSNVGALRAAANAQPVITLTAPTVETKGA